jgi:hypothetical protein
MQAAYALQALRQPGPSESAAVLALDLDIMMILSPVVSDEQHPSISLPVK